AAGASPPRRHSAPACDRRALSDRGRPGTSGGMAAGRWHATVPHRQPVGGGEQVARTATGRRVACAPGRPRPGTRDTAAAVDRAVDTGPGPGARDMNDPDILRQLA